MKTSDCTRLAALVVLVACSGCPAPKVVVTDEHGRRKEVTVDEAARLEWKALANKLPSMSAEKRVEPLREFLQRYGDTKAAEHALAALGDTYFELGRWQDAAEQCRRIMTDFPGGTHYIHAAVRLGVSLARLGRTSEALPTLQSVFGSLGKEQKAEVAGMLAESYIDVGQPVEALRWFAELHRYTGVAGARQAIERRVVDLIDEHLDFTGVRKAYEMLRQAGIEGFPLGLLSFKLAKIFYHILDLERARGQLEDFIAAFPDHPLAAEAGNLLRLIDERGKVDRRVIGVLLPLSGEYREYGRRALEGIQLGAGIFDSKAGPDAPLLVIRDTAGDPDRAVAMLEELVLQEHAIAVIGPMVAKETYAAAMKAEELGVPLVTLSIRKGVPGLGRFVFRNFLTLRAQAELLVRYAMEKLGAKRFAILYPNDWYGVEFTNELWDEIDRRQGEVRGAEHYAPDAKNFAPPIKKLVGKYYLEARWDFVRERDRIRREIKSPLGRKRAMEKLLKKLRPVVDFDVLFVPDYFDKVALIAPALAVEDIILHTDSKWKIERLKKSLGRNRLDMIYLMGGNGFNDERLVQWAERYVQGAIFCGGFFARSKRPATRLFVGRFRAAFDREPSMVEAHAYDTAAILRMLVEKVKPVDREQMREALLGVREFDGATGKTSFGPDGEAQKELFLLTVKKDAIEEIELEHGTDAASG
ncbi:MAG: hypothetical protein D6806_15330 [Deltaproteobacteria bacterium]|nr:MAG: hypothetical protein D6806_15330 [Deltaproteobacteria bacterium]